MKTEAPFQLDFVLDQKAAISEQDDGSLLIEGYASDFGYDRQDEAFEPGAFDQGMKAFMDSNPIVVYHHKYDKAMGRVLDWEKKAQGIWVKAQVDKAEPGTELADVFRKVENGTIRGFSIGGKFHRRPGADGRARIFKADVAELSITPLPINPRTLFAVAGKAFGEDLEFDAKAAEERLNEVRTILEDLEAKTTPQA